MEPEPVRPDQHRLAVVEIAGRDSVAAALVATRERGFTRLLPTVAFTGTESGDQHAPNAAIDVLRQRLPGLVEVLPPVRLQDGPLWSALNARFSAEIQERFGIYSPCLACHLYMHLLRVPVAWGNRNAPVIAGERDTHSGRIKLSQTPASIDASIEVLGEAGVELIEPIRGVDQATEIERLVGADWPEGGKQLECLLSGNYVSLDGTVRYDKAGYERYIREFFMPVGKAVITAWRTAPAPDYRAIVRRVLES